MRTFKKSILTIFACLGTLAVVFGINLLVIGGAYWLICLLLNLTFSWKYALAIEIIFIVLKLIFKEKNNDKN